MAHFYCIFHAESVELTLFFDRSLPLSFKTIFTECSSRDAQKSESDFFLCQH